MSDHTESEAAELAERAAEQAKHAGKNAGRAAKAAVEPVIEHVANEARDTAEKLEGTVEDAVSAIREVPPHVYRQLAGHTVVGLLAVGVSVYAGKFAVGKILYTIGFAKGISAAKSDSNGS